MQGVTGVLSSWWWILPSNSILPPCKESLTCCLLGGGYSLVILSYHDNKLLGVLSALDALDNGCYAPTTLQLSCAEDVMYEDLFQKNLSDFTARGVPWLAQV